MEGGERALDQLRRRAEQVEVAGLEALEEPRQLRESALASALEQARRELAERGVPCDDEPHLIARMPDHELWMTFFRDPDRNLLGLMCELSPESP